MNLFATLLLMLTSISAYSADIAILDDYGIVNLRQDVSEVDFHANYPGHSGKEDCLVFVSDALSHKQRASLSGMKELIKELEVYSGDGILFNQRDIKLLAYNTNNTDGYVIPQVWRYVTGIRVAAKTGTLRSLVDFHLPNYDGIIGLQRVPRSSNAYHARCRT